MKRTVPSTTPLTAERAARLHKLLKLVAGSARPRALLLAKLDLDVRGFYRDLKYLRAAGVEIAADGDKYLLVGELATARGRVPLPDPGLTLDEANQLARGSSPAHRKLRSIIDAIVGAAKANGTH